MSELFEATTLEIIRGRRECRMRVAPEAACAAKSTRVSNQGYTATTGIPCTMVLTVSFVLSSVTMAWLPPSPVRRECVFTTLAPALERQNHTTSPSAQTPLVAQQLRPAMCVHRIPLPTSVTIASRPSSRERDKRNEATDLGVRSIAADRDRLARRANYAGEACTLRHHLTTATHDR